MEGRLKREIALADRFVAAVARDEARWIKARGDVDAKFRRKYMRRVR